MQASKFAGRISLDQLAQMSSQDFDSHLYHTEEADPPSFTRNQRKSAQQQARGGGGGARGAGGRRLPALTVRQRREEEVFLACHGTDGVVGGCRWVGRQDGSLYEDDAEGDEDEEEDEVVLSGVGPKKRRTDKDGNAKEQLYRVGQHLHHHHHRHHTHETNQLGGG